jgi:hypothetical protein
MRTLSIAAIAAALVFPSAVSAQDNQASGGGPNGAAVGPTLGSPGPASSPGAEPFVGYPALPGSEAPRNLVTSPVPGGFVSAIVAGHSVIIDPTTNVIVRVIN